MNSDSWIKNYQTYIEKVQVKPELLNILKNDFSVEVNSSEQLILSIYEDLTELIWMELALLDLMKFKYQYDLSEGDHFGPEDLEFGDSTEIFISPRYEVNSFYQESNWWINCNYFEDYNPEEDEDAAEYLSGNTYEAIPDKKRIQFLLEKSGFSYTKLEEELKQKIVEALLETLEIDFFKENKISITILNYLKMHPATPKNLIDLIDKLK